MTEGDTTRIAVLEERMSAHERMHGTRMEELRARVDEVERSHHQTIVTMLLIAGGSAGVAATIAALLVRFVR
jgi:hypothetical protein